MDVTDVDDPKTHGDVAACVAAHDDSEINRLKPGEAVQRGASIRKPHY
jgi:hypothetical protein